MQAGDATAFSISTAKGVEYQEVNLGGPYPNHPWQQLTISGKFDQVSVVNWTPLMADLALLGRLTLAVSIDREYGAWQQCSKPEFYATHFGSTEGFRIVRVPGEPPLPDQFRLDTGTNPGRQDRVNNRPAMVAADMWLGPAFWDYAPCRKDEIVKQKWLNVQETEQFLHINAYPEPFTQPDGEQGEIQRRLWRLLFHLDCQWPPKWSMPPG
jgi:hypothetical protein